MRAGRGQFARVAVMAVCLAVGAGATMQAQGRGGGGPGGGPLGGPGGGPGMGGPGPVAGPPPQQRGPGPEGRPGFQLGPPGRWWDDRATVKSLRLSPEQQTRMDAIFEQNRGELQARFENVRQAEMQMEELARSDAPVEVALFAQIDRVAQARAELEKANTHLLLQLRREMDAEQIRRLEKMH
jgi:Spy/CpxP family protein refolding chaperone